MRLNILVKVWLDEAKPLLDAAFDISATLTNITQDFLAIQVSSRRRGWEVCSFAYGVVIDRDQHLPP